MSRFVPGRDHLPRITTLLSAHDRASWRLLIRYLPREHSPTVRPYRQSEPEHHRHHDDGQTGDPEDADVGHGTYPLLPMMPQPPPARVHRPAPGFTINMTTKCEASLSG
jgi:hypothetical protein